MVEFAIAAPVFVLLVAGVIQFGVALNYWLDMQRIANQGARWAVVDQYPTNDPAGLCLRTTTPAGSCPQTLQEVLASEPVSGGLNPCVDITLPEGNAVGRPVTVHMETPFQLVPIIGVATLTIGADATMRQEWPATQYSEADNTC
jgi:hypothetical protein